MKNEATRYLNPKEMKIAFPPDYKIYPPGAYTFSLKAGETTDRWIMFPLGTTYAISSKNYSYKLIYDDGQIVKDGENVKYPQKSRTKFKIVAITDQPKIKMVVSK